MDKFAKIRDDNYKEQIRRFKEIADNCTEVAGLLAEKQRLQLTFDNALLSSDGFFTYTKNIKDINARIKNALVKNGYNKDFLEPIYTCAKCQDRGYYYVDDTTPVRCLCNQTETAKEFNTFNNFDLSVFSKEIRSPYKLSSYDNMENNLSYIKDYCNNFPNNARKNMLFFGESGTGKSFTASCVCGELQNKGFSVVKVNAYALIMDFKAMHINDTPYPFDYYGCDFLVIDDIGTEPIYRNITLEYLFSLVNERIEKGKSTLFITNLDVENLRERYDDRLASRIYDGLLSKRLIFFGDNMRLR